MAWSEMGVVGRAAVGAAAPGARFSGALVLALSTVLLTTGLAVAAPPEAGQAAGAGEDDFGLVNINKADPVARRDLRGIGLALMIFESMNRRFPAAAICDGNGKPLLSWRVAILPYLEQANLYGQFRLDEPWNSEHNLTLLEKMPAVYASDGTRPGSGMTRYLVPTGPGTLFPDPATSLGMAAVSDGISRTILAVEAEADRAVPWTKPDDLPLNLPSRWQACESREITASWHALATRMSN